jgi:hypothetical protein
MNRFLLASCVVYTVLISVFFILVIERQWEWHFKTLKAHATTSISDKQLPLTALQTPWFQGTSTCIGHSNN